MRALHVPAAGESPILGELPTPEVTPGNVLVKVRAASLNPVDNIIADGVMAGMMEHQYPLVLGRDAAGVVEAVGAGVEHVQVGDAVFGHILLAPPIQAGTLAEYAVLPAAAVAIKPEGVDFVMAAALPLAAAAAVAAVSAVEPHPGEVVLVNGASGGVGSYAVQLIADHGATVVATGTEVDRDRLTMLGADQVVDYTTGTAAEQVRASFPDGVDALVNLAGQTTAEVPLDAVRTNGKVATTTMAPSSEAIAAAGLIGGSIFATPVRETTAPLAAKAATGTLAVDVPTVLPFEQATDGLATLAAGHAHGKIVVTISD
jgi:NADPH:quinone reductase-like Zn-dependent oxidoreductase